MKILKTFMSAIRLKDKLTSELAGVREELRLQREQSVEHHRDLQSRFDRMEERAITAEERVAKAELALSKSSAYADELNTTIVAFLDGTALRSHSQKKDEVTIATEAKHALANKHRPYC